MEKTRIITKERDHPKTTGLTGTATTGEDLTIMTTTALTGKQPQDTKTTTIKEKIIETVDTATITEMTLVEIGSSGQEPRVITTNHPKTCSTDHDTCTTRISTEKESLIMR
jgi:hypothetical protein